LFSDSDSSWYWYVSGSTQQWRLNLPPGKTNPQYTISNIEVSALNSLDNAYTKLLCYKVDPWESQWMIEGFASLSEFFVEGKASFCGAGDPTTPTADALMNFTNGLKTRIDFHNSYLFLLYLYEKFGGLDFIKKLAVQPAVGMTAIEETFAKMLIDYPNEDPFVRNLWQTYSAEDVFSSYGMACLLDTTNMAYTDSTNTALYDPAITPDNRMFQFDNANLYGVISNKNATILKWDAVKGAPPYDISQEGWSFNYYYSTFNVLAGLTNPMIASTFYLDSSAAMVDTMMINILYPFSSLNFYQVALRNEAVVTFNNPDFYFKYFPADMVNKQISFPLSPDTNWTFYHFGEVVDSTTGDTVINQIGDYKTMVLVGILGGTGKITQETIPPTLTQLSVAQSPIVANRFDIYLIVSDLVWGDGSTAGDVPQIRYTYEGVTTTLLMTPYNFLTGFGYQGDYSFYTSYLNFENPGTYTIEAYFTDLAGEEYIIGPVNFIVSSFNPGSGTSFDIEGATISLAPSAFSSPLKISAKTVLVNALPGANGEFLYNTAYFNAPPVETREPLGPAYHIQPEVMLNEPANISLPYANFIGSHSPSELGVYLYRDGEWIYLGGTPDPNTQTINVRAKQLGLFQIQAGPHGTTPLDLLIPDRYALKQNYPNPFNPTTKIEYQIAHADKVTLKVYDILGREVANLIDGFQNTGFYSAYWNGCSESGVPVASGVYLYRLKSGKFDKTCKMLLLK
jgi:hypothetical protein